MNMRASMPTYRATKCADSIPPCNFEPVQSYVQGEAPRGDDRGAGWECSTDQSQQQEYHEGCRRNGFVCGTPVTTAEKMYASTTLS